MQKNLGLWCLSLGVVGTLGSAVTAQVVRGTPRVVSGADLGFRIEGTDRGSGRPFGTLVVRVDGHWVEASSAARITPATTP